MGLKYNVKVDDYIRSQITRKLPKLRTYILALRIHANETTSTTTPRTTKSPASCLSLVTLCKYMKHVYWMSNYENSWSKIVFIDAHDVSRYLFTLILIFIAIVFVCKASSIIFQFIFWMKNVLIKINRINKKRLIKITI